MTVLIRNNERAPFVLTLELNVDYGKELAPTDARMQFPATTADGTPGYRVISKQIPQSLTWGPRETLPCHPNVAEHPVVRSRVAAGLMRIDQAPEAEEA